MLSYFFVIIRKEFGIIEIHKKGMETVKVQDKTRFKLAKSMKELMKSKPLDKITVTDIVENCDVSRQSFYRLFQDKYDLVNWYFEVLAQQSFKQMGVLYTLKEGLMKKFQFIEQEYVFFAQAFASQDNNSLIHYDFECIYNFYKNLIETKNKAPLTSELSFLLEMYCHGSVSMTMEWIATDRKQPIETIVDLLIEALPDKLKEQLKELL